MGLYSYIGRGEQVKCFYIPNILFDYAATTQSANVRFQTVGGVLKHYDEVPYQTYYYNYRKDFGILEYELEQRAYLHIINDGKYTETIFVDELTDNQVIPHMIVDDYGAYIDVHKAKEVKAFIDEYNKTFQAWNNTKSQLLKEHDLPVTMDMERARSLSSTELSQELRLRTEIQDESYNKTMYKFNKHYYTKSDCDLCIIGMVLYEYEHCLDINKQYSFVNRHEFEWYSIFSAAVDELKDDYEEPLSAYFMWCEGEGVEVDREWARSLFEKYTIPPTEELKESYVHHLKKRTIEN